MSNATKYAVLTAVGADQPGIVSRMSAVIHAGGANIEDSRMAILGGEFALILLFSGAEGAVTAVGNAAIAAGESLGLAVTLRATSRALSPSDHLLYRLRVTGVDHPGIVVAVTELLAKNHVNVASLDSEVRYAPLSGTPMFVLNAAVQVPTKLVLSSLRRALGEKCDAENLDYTLESA